MEEPEFTKRAERLRAVNEVVKDLDPALKPEAVAILKPYVTDKSRDDSQGPDPAGGGGGTGAQSGSLRERLLDEHGEGKPSDNALLCAALWFADYGKAPFSLDQLRALGNELGVTLPERIDVTIGGAQRKGKRLFNRARKGYYSPTTHGETFFKATYAVRQGSGTPPDTE